MKEYFSTLASNVDSLRKGDEFYTLNFSAEDTHFTRFNQGQVRQPSHVSQAVVDIRWIHDGRQVSASLQLTRGLDRDLALIKTTINSLRQQLKQIPEDPHLSYKQDHHSGSKLAAPSDNDPHQITEQIANKVSGSDFVGLCTCGKQYAGFANANGQFNWYSFDDFNVDWSVYVKTSNASESASSLDKAAKGVYADQVWSETEFAQSFEQTLEQAELLKSPAKELQPGKYRVYLAPSALVEIVRFLDFGYQRWANKTNLLQRWYDGEAELNAWVNIHQNPKLGLAADFNDAGYSLAKKKLIQSGQPAEKLISPRSSLEFGCSHNGADESEHSPCQDMQAGDLEESGILQALDEGIYINNLHYLNVSDHSSARLTGMTRFACFWVKEGKLQAPIEVLRFDDSIYRMLGSELARLTAKRKRIVSDSTYFQRSRGGIILPGALINNMQFTL